MPLAAATTALSRSSGCDLLMGAEGSLEALLEGRIGGVKVFLGTASGLALGSEVSCMVEA